MQQVNTPADNDGNACSWRQHQTFDKGKQQASPMSRGAKNSVQQHDTIIINIIVVYYQKPSNDGEPSIGKEVRSSRHLLEHVVIAQDGQITELRNQFCALIGTLTAHAEKQAQEINNLIINKYTSKYNQANDDFIQFKWRISKSIILTIDFYKNGYTIVYFDDDKKTSKLLILISDGEDHSEGASEAAEAANKLGLKIVGKKKPYIAPQI
jgi:hypothetical protein